MKTMPDFGAVHENEAAFGYETLSLATRSNEVSKTRPVSAKDPMYSIVTESPGSARFGVPAGAGRWT